MINQRLYTFLSIVLLVFYSVSFSQVRQERSIVPEPLPMAPISIVPVQPAEKPIEVASMDIVSDIYGHVAQTTLTLSFYNPNSRNISADFIFPIPAHSTINGYALDVNGVMVDGVAVEKKKARVTFDKIVRQGIDPGLIEKVQGNVFKARIFPIAAQKRRTIQIHFSSVLNDNNIFQVPLMTGQKINDFSMKLQAMNMSSKPIITTSDFDGLSFTQWDDFYVFNFNKKALNLTKPLSIVIPQVVKNSVVVGKNDTDDYYFSINPTISTSMNHKMERFSKPERKINKIQLVWDASHSRYGKDHQQELAFLQSFFNLHQQVEVDLYVLRNTMDFERTYQVKKGQWQDLKHHLLHMAYDGATDLSQLNQLKKIRALDAVLFFTDGLHTFTERQPINVSAPLFIITNNVAGNFALSEQMAERNNGQAIHLSSVHDLASLARIITQDNMQLISIEVHDGVIEKLPSYPHYLSNSNKSISGQLISNEAMMTLNYGISGRITQSIKINLSKEVAFTTALPENIWVQQKLKSLHKDKENNKNSIIELSQKYNVVSEFTSLIVLESLQQYVDNEIAPPKSLEQMRSDYFAQIKSRSKITRDHKVSKIEQVVSMWKKRKQWWDKEFPEYVKKKPKKQTFRRLNDDVTETEELDSITVTGSNIRGVDLEGQRPATVVHREALAPAPRSTPQEAKKQQKASVGATVEISDWDPDTPYLKALKKEQKHNRAALYYDLKKTYHNSPAFYFDSADFFFKNQQKAFGLQVLSNIAELKIQDSRLLRTMAMKLKEYHYTDLSIYVYRQVLADRDEEPQSFRDLALALQIRADETSTKADYQEAIELLYQVITNKWDRFHGIEVTVLMEINQMIPQLTKMGIDYSFIDKRLIALLDVDVRIVLGWDSDMTDIDLWVIEPNGEKVTYNKTLSTVGGMFHQDFTGGYGPEEYLLHKAPKGDYQIKVHFYGNRSPELSGATTLYVDVFTNYGRASQKKQTLSLRLDKANDSYLVGKVNIDI